MPQHYGNKKKRRSGDPNLEPGLAAATRRSQRTRKATPKIDPLPRKQFKLLGKKFKKMEAIEDRLVPNIGTPVPRRRVPEFPPAIGTDFPYGRPVTPRTVTPKPTRKRKGPTRRSRK